LCPPPNPLSRDDIVNCSCDKKKGTCEKDICMNRILYTECIKGKCGKKCTNNDFQNFRWKKVEVRDVPKKGKGLFVLENIKKDEFIIEYVGEVLDNDLLDKRVDENPGDHFYYLTLASNRIIDASMKGNDASNFFKIKFRIY
jgi:SET domain-containing protein